MSSTNEILEQILELNKKNGNIVNCPQAPTTVPGITAADAFDAGDTFGTFIKLPVPKSGRIYSATYYDMDDEGTEIDFYVFDHEIPQIASDAAWAPTDDTMSYFVTKLAFVVFTDVGGMQVSELFNIGKAYSAPTGFLWLQGACVGTPNIAAGNMPKLRIQIDSDDATWQER